MLALTSILTDPCLNWNNAVQYELLLAVLEAMGKGL